MDPWELVNGWVEYYLKNKDKLYLIGAGSNLLISDKGIKGIAVKLGEKFSNISVNIKNNVLSIVVKENPMINKVNLEGEKAKKFKEKILEMLSLRANASFIEAKVFSGASKEAPR